jgi:hypothetical protein
VNEFPLSLAVQLGIDSVNAHGGDFNPHQTNLTADFYLSSGLGGIVALPAEHQNSNARRDYELVKLPVPPTSAAGISAADLWECAKEHYGLSAATLVTGAGGIPIKKLHLGYPVVMGSSKYTNLVSHFGLKFFPMATLPRGSTVANMAKSAFGTIRVFGVVGRALPFVAIGLAIYDAVSIGMCAYEERRAK